MLDTENKTSSLWKACARLLYPIILIFRKPISVLFPCAREVFSGGTPLVAWYKTKSGMPDNRVAESPNLVIFVQVVVEEHSSFPYKCIRDNVIYRLKT